MDAKSAHEISKADRLMQLRVNCLELAIRNPEQGRKPIEIAQEYFDWLKGDRDALKE
jgi:hypothetical protein